METTDSTEESPPSLGVQPSSEGQESTSEPIPSLGDSPRSALEPHMQYSLLTEPSSDSLLEVACPESQQIDHGTFDYPPLYVSYIPRNPCRTAPSSSTVADSSYPGQSSVPSSGPCSGSGSGLGQSSDAGKDTGPTYKPRCGSASGPALALGPGLVSEPGSGTGHKVSSNLPQGFGNLPSDLLPNSSTWYRFCYCEPHRQPWQPLQVSEPGVRGQLKLPEAEGKSGFLCKTLPRGQCLLHNWEEERATNQLDQIPRLQDGSESYFFRHGHQGLLSMQLQAAMPGSTTQKDSYQLPRNVCQPLRGVKHERWGQKESRLPSKEVQAEQDPPRKLFEAESVTHRDYTAKMVQTGPPAPTKPHDYRQEQPETFWKQRAPQLPVCGCD
ncbi:Sperm-associated antigen 8 [Lemmus lemmus]